MKVLATIALIAAGLTLSSCASCKKSKCCSSDKKKTESCCAKPAAKGKTAKGACCSN